MAHVRCSRCQGRSTLARHPKEYIRLPRCGRCGRKMEYDPVKRRTPHYYVDRWRERNEIGAGLKRRGQLCYPGRGGCYGYFFPHRRGSRFCDHNPNLTEADLQERHESGGRC